MAAIHIFLNTYIFNHPPGRSDKPSYTIIEDSGMMMIAMHDDDSDQFLNELERDINDLLNNGSRIIKDSKNKRFYITPGDMAVIIGTFESDQLRRLDKTIKDIYSSNRSERSQSHRTPFHVGSPSPQFSDMGNSQTYGGLSQTFYSQSNSSKPTTKNISLATPAPSYSSSDVVLNDSTEPKPMHKQAAKANAEPVILDTSVHASTSFSLQNRDVFDHLANHLTELHGCTILPAGNDEARFVKPLDASIHQQITVNFANNTLSADNEHSYGLWANCLAEGLPKPDSVSDDAQVIMEVEINCSAGNTKDNIQVLVDAAAALINKGVLPVMKQPSHANEISMEQVLEQMANDQRLVILVKKYNDLNRQFNGPEAVIYGGNTITKNPIDPLAASSKHKDNLKQDLGGTLKQDPVVSLNSDDSSYQYQP